MSPQVSSESHSSYTDYEHIMVCKEQRLSS
jgi:hypothetical protein